MAAYLAALAWTLAAWRRGTIPDRRTFQTLLRLRALSDHGYYHCIQVNGHTTDGIGGRRPNRPLNDPTYSDVLWQAIRAAYAEPLDGKRVVDIGPMEGYFTLQALQEGASVTTIQLPAPVIASRLRVLADYFRVISRLTMVEGRYPEVGHPAVQSADLTLCLGVLYHLRDVDDALRRLLSVPGVVVLESWVHKPCAGACGFRPAAHDATSPLCSAWFAHILNASGRLLTWLPAWQQFVERPGNLRHTGTRQAVVIR